MALNQNRINEIIDAPILTGINADIAHIITHLPGGGTITIDPEEHKTLLAMDVDNRIQADKVLQVMAGPAAVYIPGFFSADALQKDVTLFDQLVGIENQLADALSRVRDLKRLTGHEAASFSLAVYGNIEIAAKNGLPGAQAAYDLLKQRFSGQGGGGEQQQTP